MAFALSQELAERDVTAIAVTPGFLRSEWMLDHFGVTEANWHDATAKAKEFALDGSTVAGSASGPLGGTGWIARLR